MFALDFQPLGCPRDLGHAANNRVPPRQDPQPGWQAHRYCSAVENRFVARQRTAQRTVLYLGEIHDSQQEPWCQTLEVFDETRQQYAHWSLFREDREIPATAPNKHSVKLHEMELRRARAYGNGWLGGELWRQWRREEFWQEKWAGEVQRETVPWEKVTAFWW
jgi:hypothetical protein